MTSITIPNSVTSIGYEAFRGCRLKFIMLHCKEIGGWFSGIKTIRDITIGDGVTSIGGYAFSGCSGLTSITISNSVTSIGDNAFAECSSLPTINIPNSVTSIGGFAFYGCSSLTSITIPNSVTSIGGYAFNDCSSLTSVTILNSVTAIGGWAFYDCRSLTSITIPNNITSIGDYAFDGTAWYNNQPDGLIYVGKVAYKYKGTMPDNTKIVLEEGTSGITGGAFVWCGSLTSITIPNSVTSIGNEAFRNCSGLASITIPNSVTSIGSNAFYNCSSLKEVYVESPTPPSVEANSFDSFRTTSKVLYVPTASVNDYKNSIWYDFFSNILGYTPTPSEIKAVSDEDCKETARYTLDGRRSSIAEKGINIIKMNDGTTKKVMVR